VRRWVARTWVARTWVVRTWVVRTWVVRTWVVRTWVARTWVARRWVARGSGMAVVRQPMTAVGSRSPRRAPGAPVLRRWCHASAGRCGRAGPRSGRSPTVSGPMVSGPMVSWRVVSGRVGAQRRGRDIPWKIPRTAQPLAGIGVGAADRARAGRSVRRSRGRFHRFATAVPAGRPRAAIRRCRRPVGARVRPWSRAWWAGSPRLARRVPVLRPGARRSRSDLLAQEKSLHRPVSPGSLLARVASAGGSDGSPGKR
jgi:hypothetical protein